MSVRVKKNTTVQDFRKMVNGSERLYSPLFPTLLNLSIILVVVVAIFLTAANLLKMKMMPATSELSVKFNFATHDLIAIVHRMVVVCYRSFEG